ncbi:MAG: RNA 2',3'-cyclic phosphodiesterase [Chloroflexi bacterium]|nr:MAG: RNA 2',3'-cyclic phosphodiesterase [Chloroflexota bacterium]
MRCFLAIPLAEPALGEAQRLLARLRDDVAAVRWARPETLHMTLHFFGQIASADGERGAAAIAPGVAGTSPTGLTLDRLGSFPERGGPRVLWLGASAVPSTLLELAARCRHALRDQGFAVEARPFRPHCTLGRPRLPWPDTARTAWRAASDRPLQPMPFVADRVVLYESHPGPGGSVYSVRATVLMRA